MWRYKRSIRTLQSHTRSTVCCHVGLTLVWFDGACKMSIKCALVTLCSRLSRLVKRHDARERRSRQQHCTVHPERLWLCVCRPRPGMPLCGLCSVFTRLGSHYVKTRLMGASMRRRRRRPVRPGGPIPVGTPITTCRLDSLGRSSTARDPPLGLARPYTLQLLSVVLSLPYDDWCVRCLSS